MHSKDIIIFPLYKDYCCSDSSNSLEKVVAKRTKRRGWFERYIGGLSRTWSVWYTGYEKWLDGSCFQVIFMIYCVWYVSSHHRNEPQCQVLNVFSFTGDNLHGNRSVLPGCAKQVSGDLWQGCGCVPAESYSQNRLGTLVGWVTVCLLIFMFTFLNSAR